MVPGQRHFRRIPFEAVAMVATAEHSHACDLVNLALSGALVHAPQGLPLRTGERCRVSIFLPATDLTLSFEAELVRCNGEAYGFRFVGEDVETLGHLRRLLELNFGDSEEAEAEFNAWLKG